MPEDLSVNVQRLKYKHTFVNMSTQVGSDNLLKNIQISGPLVRSENSDFSKVCKEVNKLLDADIYKRRTILSVLNRMPLVDADILRFVGNLIGSHHLPLED